jgi:ABC-type transporter Mla MlaB component
MNTRQGVSVLYAPSRFGDNCNTSFDIRARNILCMSEGGCIINFRDVDHVGSGMLARLMAMSREFSDEGRTLVFCSVKESLRRVFDLCGFFERVSVFESEDEALESLNSGEAGTPGSRWTPKLLSIIDTRLYWPTVTTTSMSCCSL